MNGLYTTNGHLLVVKVVLLMEQHMLEQMIQI